MAATRNKNRENSQQKSYEELQKALDNTYDLFSKEEKKRIKYQKELEQIKKDNPKVETLKQELEKTRQVLANLKDENQSLKESIDALETKEKNSEASFTY